jgi:ABC-type amino acid transport substrate-binding protein
MFNTMFRLLFAALLLAGIAASASDTPVMDRVLNNKVLVVGTSGNMPPMTYKLQSGDVAGLDMELAQLMASGLGVKLKVVVMPFPDLVDAVKSGKVDVAISNITATLARNRHVAFSTPYLISGKCVVTKQKEMATMENAEAVNGKKVTVAVLKGSTSEEFASMLMKDAKLIDVNSDADGIDLVRSGKADAMLSDYPVCMAAVNNNPDAGFVASFSKLTYEPISIALPGNDPLFLNWTNNFVSRLKTTGAIDGLMQQWLGKPQL